MDDAKENVEEAPERVAGWTGDKVGDAERYGDNVQERVGEFNDNVGNAYDQGKQEGRDDY